jgi:hypothetical protein
LPRACGLRGGRGLETPCSDARERARHSQVPVRRRVLPARWLRL